jgi:N-acyl-D-amino-acid deacylase
LTKSLNGFIAWFRATAVLSLATVGAAAACSSARPSAAPPFDLVIENGHIIDGTGSPWYAGDLGIRGEKIAAIGHLAHAAATRRVDAHGMVIAPGFIDMLGQSELTILVNPHLPSKIFQGITTEITGEGGSIAPLSDAIVAADHVSYEHYKVTPDWRTLAQYFGSVRPRFGSRPCDVR